MDNEWKWQQENARLQKALEYYADERNYQRNGMTKMNVRISDVDTDKGKKARRALGKI